MVSGDGDDATGDAGVHPVRILLVVVLLMQVVMGQDEVTAARRSRRTGKDFAVGGGSGGR